MMPRLRVLRSICAALVAAILVSGTAPARAETHDTNTFANTADSIINLLTSPATPKPARRPRPAAVPRQAHVVRPRPVVAVHAKPKPQPQHVVAARPKAPRARVVIARPRMQPKLAVAARPARLTLPPRHVAAIPPATVPAKMRPHPPVAARPPVRPTAIVVAKPKASPSVVASKPKAPRVVSMIGSARTLHAHKRKPFKPAHGGHGIAIVRPWQGSIPDTYCDLPTGCATAAPAAPEAATAGTAAGTNAK